MVWPLQYRTPSAKLTIRRVSKGTDAETGGPQLSRTQEHALDRDRLIYFPNTFSIFPTFFSTLPALCSALPSASKSGLFLRSDLNAGTCSGQRPPHLLPKHFFDLPDLFFNFAGVVFGSAFSL